VSEAMKEMRRQKRNTYHWTLPALENTLFFMKFYRKAKATKFTSHGIVLVVFVPIKKKLAPIGRRMENLWPFYASAVVFVRYTLGSLENLVGMRTENFDGLEQVL